MNKEKLVSLIVKKDTYKDTKPVQADIAKNKQEAVTVSISAIHQVLKDDYNAEAKLYAVRYLKDCFEKGNESFISKVQQKILPTLLKIAKDSEDENRVLKYGGSYTKNSDLEKFKSLVTSLFTISQECILKWGTWIPNEQRMFWKAKKELAYLKKDGFSYFRQENEDSFRENCKKNGITLASKVEKRPSQDVSGFSNIKKDQVLKGTTHAKKDEGAKKENSALKKENSILKENSVLKENSTIKKQEAIKHKYASIGKINNIVLNLEEAIKRNEKLTKKDLEGYEAKLNSATNEYLEEASEFDEKYLEAQIQKFEELKLVIMTPKHQEEASSAHLSLGVNSVPKIGQEQQKAGAKMSAGAGNTQQKKVLETSKLVKEMQCEKETQPQPKIVVKQAIKQVKNTTLANLILEEKKQQDERVFFDESYSEASRSKQSKPKKPTDPIRALGQNTTKEGEGNKSTAKFLAEDEFTPIQNNLKVPNPKMPPIQTQIKSEAPKSPSSNRNNSETVKSPKNGNVPTQMEMDLLKKRYEQETQQLYHEIERLEKEMSNVKRNENQSKVSQSSNAMHSKELELLKQKLEDQKREKQQMEKEIKYLKAELMKSKQKYENDKSELEKSKLPRDMSILSSFENQARMTNPSGISLSHKIKKVKPTQENENWQLKSEFGQSKMKRSFFPVDGPSVLNPYSPRMDEDYLNNMGYDKIGSWLDETNQLRFKQSILGICDDCFYKDENLRIYKMQNLFSESKAEFLKLTFSFHFQKIQDKLPKVIYKNISQIDFWTKPIAGTQEKYSQETIGRLCMVPLKIMKGSVYFEQGRSANFLLPFLYYSYLRTDQFDSEEFEDIIKMRQHHTVKSKVFYLNNYISHTAVDLVNVFKNSVLSNQLLQICLREEGEERVFMTQIELLRNMKAVIRVLPIPSSSEMLMKAKELINNLVFLLG